MPAWAGPQPVADHSPPLEGIGPGGKWIDPGEETELVPATPGRVKIRVSHRGEAGNSHAGGDVFVGWGQTASGDDPDDEVGDWIEPRGFVEEFFAGAVRVRNTGDNPVRVTCQEFGT